jgi:hypothetical protein
MNPRETKFPCGEYVKNITFFSNPIIIMIRGMSVIHSIAITLCIPDSSGSVYKGQMDFPQLLAHQYSLHATVYALKQDWNLNFQSLRMSFKSFS